MLRPYCALTPECLLPGWHS